MEILARERAAIYGLPDERQRTRIPARCRHAVLIASADVVLQSHAGIPERDRVAWSCEMCRGVEMEYSPDALLRLARANTTEKQAA